MKKIGIAILCLALPAAAFAQDAERKNQTIDRAGKIVTQPVRDVGLDKAKIPEVLQRAVENPYALPRSRTCSALNLALGELNAVLGADFVAGAQENEDRAGKIAEAVGKTIVNSLIPFRGLVREITGAAPAERRLEGAVAAGIARRGYLRGLAGAKGCKIAPIAPRAPLPKDKGEEKK